MDALSRSSVAQALLNRLTEKLDLGDDPALEPTPLIHFLVGLTIVLQGVIVIDRQIHWTEEQLFQEILGQFWEPGSLLQRQITALMTVIKEQQLYLDPSILDSLRESLSPEEKRLILALGWSLSAVDGHTELRETLYLQNIAQRLQISSEELSLLQSGFTPLDPLDPLNADRLSQLRAALSPVSLDTISPVLSKVALQLLAQIGRAHV